MDLDDALGQIDSNSGNLVQGLPLSHGCRLTIRTINLGASAPWSEGGKSLRIHSSCRSSSPALRYATLLTLSARQRKFRNRFDCWSKTGGNSLRRGIAIAGDNFSAYVPDLPGCIATGATLVEVETNIQKAIEFHIDGLEEDGEQVPPPNSQVEYVEVET
ncbi:MAG: type II toxin-antitoxin system HicB family antitoxin [Burkholderiaceae bacterium]